MGAVFWDQALAAIEVKAAQQLPALVRRELTLPRAGAPRAGLREYAFRHQILHQVIYDTVLKRHKREGHARVAQWLANLTSQGGLRAGDLFGLAAEHFERSGDAGRAAEFHARATEYAGQRFAHDRVLAHVRRALAQLGESKAHTLSAEAELRWRLLIVRERTFHLQGRRDEQTTDQDELNRLADALDDDLRRAEVALCRAIRAMRMADWAEQERAARHGIACATRARDDGLRLHLLRLLADAQISRGDIAGGRALALRALDEARRLGLRAVEARLLSALSVAADLEDDQLRSLDLDRQGLLIHRETGDRVNEAISLSNLGVGWLKLGNLVRARRELEAALPLLRANGDRAIEGGALFTLSVLALWQGDDARALRLARQALDIAQAAQARDVAVIAALCLGDAELTVGRLAEAQQTYAQAHAQALEIGSAWQHDAEAGLARVALANGDTSAALAALQALLVHPSDIALDGTEEPRRIELTCHVVLACVGDPRADYWLVRAHTALMAQADAIARSGNVGDSGRSGTALRQGFLHNIPWHREIVVAWAKRNAPGAAQSRSSD